MDLSTDYLGLALRSPLVASPSPLTARVDSLRALEDAGVAAVVLPSLFEEQVIHDELATAALFSLGTDAEAASYFPDLGDVETVSDRALRHVEEAKAALGIPVIASLNGTTPGGWARYGRLLQNAGADALELNLYRVVADPSTSAAQVEAQELDLVRGVAEVLDVPLAVKVGPHYSAFAHMAAGLVDAGADALVLFNRFYQPDVSPITRQVVPSIELSTPAELRLPLRWIALLHGRIDAQLAATTGIWGGLDAARALLAGADVTMLTSALLRHGPAHVCTVEAELLAWGREYGYASVAQLRGSVSQRNVADPSAFERANYIDALVHYTTATGVSSGP